ncbi:MAG: hypothetical protein IMW96_10610 [Thermoanaerobacteraceae bacterium]|nr:hypothetical protein [Thermoanaerobacteraceae bacterium]
MVRWGLLFIFWALFAVSVVTSLAAGGRVWGAACPAGLAFLGGYIFWYHLRYIPRLREASLGAGYRLLVPVPVNPVMARLLLPFSGLKLETGEVRRAFELHVVAEKGLGLAGFTRLLASDLAYLAAALEPGTLILWETRAPVPSFFRRYIREKEAGGEAAWKKGRWKAPHRGALVWLRKDRAYFLREVRF